MKRAFRFSLTFGLILIALTTIELGGVGGCGGSGVTRGLTGTISASSLTALTVTNHATGKFQTTLACSDLKVLCSSYEGEDVEVNVADDCTFTLELPIDSFCFCGLFNKDTDGYIASLGCAESSYQGAIPIFAAADGSKEDINISGVSVEGGKGVSTVNLCTLVDQDGDATADATDTDDDGDGTADGSDPLSSGGCEEADTFDSNSNDIPDIFEDGWNDLADSDEDEIPDFCDIDTGCTADAEDADGDCIPDSFDVCVDDTDGDFLPDCIDCDNSSTDLATSLACYEDLCTIDSDGDGFGLCADCDDEDATITNECETFDDFDPCAVDADGDGHDVCEDCNDDDSSVGIECETCSTAACDGDFECQLFAEDDQTDEFETDNVQCSTSTGCCELK